MATEATNGKHALPTATAKPGKVRRRDRSMLRIITELQRRVPQGVTVTAETAPELVSKLCEQIERCERERHALRAALKAML